MANQAQIPNPNDFLQPDVSKMLTEPVEFECGKRKLIYDFEKLSVHRIITAIQLFDLALEISEKLPQKPTDVTEILARQTEAKAYAAILIDENSSPYETFDPTKEAVKESVGLITGYENWLKVLECREDFFARTPLGQKQSRRQLNDWIGLLKLMPEEQLQSILTTFVQGSATAATTTLSESITTETTTTEEPENQSTDQ